MLNFFTNLLNLYDKPLNRFGVFSIVMERGENPEDIFYICDTKNGKFIVYESDYLGDLKNVIDEINVITNEPKASIVQLFKVSESVTDIQNPPYKYLVFKLITSDSDIGSHFNPTTYSHISKLT
jgi:hypothetical protein